MGYGPNRYDGYRRAAYYVDRILRGASPAELPVEHTPVELSINLTAADTLGVRLPPSLLQQAAAVFR